MAQFPRNSSSRPPPTGRANNGGASGRALWLDFALHLGDAATNLRQRRLRGCLLPAAFAGPAFLLPHLREQRVLCLEHRTQIRASVAASGTGPGAGTGLGDKKGRDLVERGVGQLILGERIFVAGADQRESPQRRRVVQGLLALVGRLVRHRRLLVAAEE